MPHCLIPISIDGGISKTVKTKEGSIQTSFANVHIFIEYEVEDTNGDSISAINFISIWLDQNVRKHLLLSMRGYLSYLMQKPFQLRACRTKIK